MLVRTILAATAVIVGSSAVAAGPTVIEDKSNQKKLVLVKCQQSAGSGQYFQFFKVYPEHSPVPVGNAFKQEAMSGLIEKAIKRGKENGDDTLFRLSDKVTYFGSHEPASFSTIGIEAVVMAPVLVPRYVVLKPLAFLADLFLMPYTFVKSKIDDRQRKKSLAQLNSSMARSSIKVSHEDFKNIEHVFTTWVKHNDIKCVAPQPAAHPSSS